MHKNVTIHIAIPAMNEAAWLPHTLRLIGREKTSDVQIWVCVNQPERYRDDPDKQSICLNNAQTLAFLNSLKNNNLHILDRSSTGKGWTGKRYGVGQARRVLMEAINETATPEDLIVSIDADTLFDPGYLSSIKKCFERHPGALALSNPYYHKLSGNNTLDRAMLRYEIYMRYYAINMWRIGSPYNFTALGSAIALPVGAYRKTGGITAKKSGEDFYFLQKLRKAGWICNHNTHKVYPGTRYSDRVFFGTGPALIKGSQGDWQSYPIYNHELFNSIKETIECFPGLYEKDVNTPMSSFLSAIFREEDPFEPLRKNASGKDRFVHACFEKVDGLRMLQFLKSESARLQTQDEEHLIRFFRSYHPHLLASTGKDNDRTRVVGDPKEKFTENIDFETSPLSLLDALRNTLMHIEQGYQKRDAS